ncbi:hypothetical protein ACFLZH_02855, partial [Patescibacteria group bacterium]
MFSKARILLGAKISLCAMLLLLIAGVVNASFATDFVFTDVGSKSVSAGSVNNLALNVVIPDGVNNSGVEDTLLVNGGTPFYTGDTLVAIPALGSTTGVGYYEAGAAGFQGTEPVIIDLDADSVYTSVPDTDVAGTPLAAGTIIAPAVDSDWTDMYFHYFSPGQPWNPANDNVFLDDGNVYYDSGTSSNDILEAGASVTTQPGTLTEPGGWNLWYYDAVNGDDYNGAADWIGVDDDMDSVYTSAADAIIIPGTDFLSAGAALYTIVAGDDICSDNTTLSSATCVYNDPVGATCDGTIGPGTYFIGSGCAAGTDTLITGAHMWATSNSAFDGTTDWYQENVPGKFTYSAAADTLIDGVVPSSTGSPITTTKDSDWTLTNPFSLYFYDGATIGTWEVGSDMIFSDDGTIYFDNGIDTFIAGAGGINDAIGTPTPPGSWNFAFYDDTDGGAWDGINDWMGIDAGGSGTYSTSADTDVYSTGGVSNTNLLTDFGADCNNDATVDVCMHSGTTP